MVIYSQTKCEWRDQGFTVTVRDQVNHQDKYPAYFKSLEPPNLISLHHPRRFTVNQNISVLMLQMALKLNIH